MSNSLSKESDREDYVRFQESSGTVVVENGLFEKIVKYLKLSNERLDVFFKEGSGDTRSFPCIESDNKTELIVFVPDIDPELGKRHRISRPHIGNIRKAPEGNSRQGKEYVMEIISFYPAKHSESLKGLLPSIVIQHFMVYREIGIKKVKSSFEEQHEEEEEKKSKDIIKFKKFVSTARKPPKNLNKKNFRSSYIMKVIFLRMGKKDSYSIENIIIFHPYGELEVKLPSYFLEGSVFFGWAPKLKLTTHKISVSEFRHIGSLELNGILKVKNSFYLNGRKFTIFGNGSVSIGNGSEKEIFLDLEGECTIKGKLHCKRRTLILSGKYQCQKGSKQEFTKLELLCGSILLKGGTSRFERAEMKSEGEIQLGSEESMMKINLLQSLMLVSKEKIEQNNCSIISVCEEEEQRDVQVSFQSPEIKLTKSECIVQGEISMDEDVVIIRISDGSLVSGTSGVTICAVEQNQNSKFSIEHSKVSSSEGNIKILNFSEYVLNNPILRCCQVMTMKGGVLNVSISKSNTLMKKLEENEKALQHHVLQTLNEKNETEEEEEETEGEIVDVNMKVEGDEPSSSEKMRNLIREKREVNSELFRKIEVDVFVGEFQEVVIQSSNSPFQYLVSYSWSRGGVVHNEAMI